MGSRIIKPGPSFSPQQLFARGRQGVWIDPGLNGTLFTTNAGDVSASAGSTVGLALDKSKNLQIGPETVTNGTFNSDLSGWTLGVDSAQVIAVWTASGVSLTRGSGGNAGFQQSLSLTVGAWYQIKFTLISGSNVAFGIAFSGATASGLGEKSYIFQAVGTTIRFWPSAISSNSVIDNISIRQIFGNHASQATAANRPTLQQSGNLYFLRHDSTDFLTATLPAINVRRNLLTYSEKFDNAVWPTTNATVVTAPYYSGVSCFGIVDNGVNGSHGIAQQNLTTTSDLYTGTVYVKRGSVDWVRIATPGANSSWFNLATRNPGIIGASVVSYSFDDLANGWFRISTTSPGAGNSTGQFLVRAQTADGQTAYIGAGTIAFYISYAQLEASPVQTSYQKITDWTSEAYSSSGSTYFGTPQGMSSLYNQSIGTTYNLPAPNTDVYGLVVVPSRLTPPEEEQLARYFRAKAGIVGSDDYLWEPGYLTDDSGEQLLLRA